MPITKDEPISSGVADVIFHTLGPARSACRRVLYFMRSIDCSVCQAHVARLAELATDLEALDAEVNVIAPGEPGDEQPAWTGTLPFPVTFSNKLFAAADLRRFLAFLQQSGTIVIDRDQKALLVRRTTLPFKAFCEDELFARLSRVCSGLPGRAQVA